MSARAARGGLAALAVLVVLRMSFHAIYLPAFEGPDEPQHLARILDFANGPLTEAFQGRWVDAEILDAVLAHPCPHPNLGCPAYGRAPGPFNLLGSHPVEGLRSHRIPNEEAKQPPLHYLLAGLPLRILGGAPSPVPALLYGRLLSVALIAIAVFGPLRLLFEGSPMAATAGLVAMLAPGAAEAFARCSNDAAVFLWAALLLLALERGPGPLATTLLLAAGPMLKLTALPVAAFALVCLWKERRRGAAIAGALACGLVVPVQAARGWVSGGALELASGRPAIVETPAGWLWGFGRTAYTLVKAPFWAMGWSLLRPPAVLVALYFGLLAALLLALRVATAARRRAAHGAGAAVALAGTVVFAVATRRYFGIWGGVTGWYVWDWSPWLALAARDLTVVGARLRRPLLAGEALFVLGANIVWFARAASAYGG